jgi:hypothetical protein
VRRDRVLEVADRGALLEHVGDDHVRREQLRFDFLLLRIVGAHGRDERAWRDVGPPEKPSARRRAGHPDVGVARGIADVAGDGDVDVELDGHVVGESSGSIGVDVDRRDPPERAHTRERAKLVPALLTAPADGDVARLRCEIFRRYGGRGGGTEAGDLDGIKKGEQAAIGGVEQRDHALDGGEPVPHRIAREVRVHLGDEHGMSVCHIEHAGRLDVESAAVYMHTEDSGRDRPAFGVSHERPLDGVDAVRHAQQARHVLPAQDEGSRGRHRALSGHAGDDSITTESPPGLGCPAGIQRSIDLRRRYAPLANAAISRSTRATMASRATANPSLTAGTSSHRSTGVWPKTSGSMSHARLTTNPAAASRAGVTRFGM